jgi:hypothetical protein
MADTNSHLNIKYSLAYHMSLFTAVQTVYQNPLILTDQLFPNLETLERFIAYSIDVQQNQAIQHTYLTYHIVARKTASVAALAPLETWLNLTETRLRDHFLYTAIPLRDFGHIVSEDQWLTLLTTGVVSDVLKTALVQALTGSPRAPQILDLGLYPYQIGGSKLVESPQAMESTATVQFMHLAVDNLLDY